jgi:predicted nucleic acid-binding protein
MLLVDTNVLVDVLQNDPQWADWSIGQLRAQAQLHELAINPVIYAELSLSFSTFEALDRGGHDGACLARGAATRAVPCRQGLSAIPQARRRQSAGPA